MNTTEQAFCDIPVILSQEQYSAVKDLLLTVMKMNRIGYIAVTHEILIETLIAFHRANNSGEALNPANTVLHSFATTISIRNGDIKTKHKAILREVIPSLDCFNSVPLAKA